MHDDVGPYLAQHFAALAEHPLVGEVADLRPDGRAAAGQGQGHGHAFAGELEVGMVCRGHCFGNGLIMRAVGDRMIIAPPLVITRAQIDEMMALIRRCLDLTLADAQRHGWIG